MQRDKENLEISRRFSAGLKDGIAKRFVIGLRKDDYKEGRIIHIDLAYPIGANILGGKSLQLVVEAKTSF